MIRLIACAAVLVLAVTATSPATGQEAQERYTLTVKVLDHAGQAPCDGCVGLAVAYNDAWERWQGQNAMQNFFDPAEFAGDGEHSKEVYDGVYTIFAWLTGPPGVGTTDASAARVDLMVAMEVPVHGDTEVTLDAREGVLLTQPTVGQEVQVRSHTAAWCHRMANGLSPDCLPLLDLSGNEYVGRGARELYVTPFPDWTLQPTWLWEQWHMGEPQPLSPVPNSDPQHNYSPTPAYMYRTALYYGHGVSAQDLTDRSFSAADFVEVPKSYHADKPETIIATHRSAKPVYPWEPEPALYGGYPSNRVFFEPGEVTEYFLADDRFVWTQRDWLHYGPEPGPSLSGLSFFGQEVYLESEAGTRRELEQHFQAPHQQGPSEANHRYWEHTRTHNFPINSQAQIAPGMVRIGDEFSPSYTHNWDSIPGRVGVSLTQGFKTSWRMWNADTGQELSHPLECTILPPGCREAWWLFSMAAGPATYRLEQTDAYPEWMEPYFLTKPSGTSTTVWTFSSVRSDAQLPPEYRCLLTPNDSGNDCQMQPLILLHYDLGLDTYNRASAGRRHTFTIEAGPHSEAIGAAQVESLKVQASFDDGATWQALSTSACGGGSDDRLQCYQVTAEHPRLEDTNGFVALRVQATDANGGTVDQTIIRAYILNTPPFTPPFANAGADFAIDEGDTALLSGAQSSAANGDTLTYSWTQTVGPAVTLSNADTATPSFVGPAVAADTPFTFELNVTDPGGLSDTDSVTVTVRNVGGGSGNLPPVAQLAATPSSGPVPLDVVLDATGSSDPDGDALSFTFNFGDGSAPVTQASPSASHRYTRTGSFSASATADDGRSGRATAATVVHVLAAGFSGRPQPAASLSASPAGGRAPITVAFDATGSHDPEGDAIVQYRFDFGDGSDPVTQAEPQVSHEYTAAGNFTASVYVTDSRGDVSEPVSVQIPVTVTITVDPAAGPLAQLTATPTRGSAPLPVTFDGSGSFGKDGAAVERYTFDFGDGSAVVARTVAEFGPDAARVTHVYATPGVFTPSLTVTDEGGEVSVQAKLTVDTTGLPEVSGGGGGGGGGSLGWLTLVPLLGIGLARRRRPIELKHDPSFVRRSGAREIGA